MHHLERRAHRRPGGAGGPATATGMADTSKLAA